MAYSVKNILKDKHDAASYWLLSIRGQDARTIAFSCGTEVERVTALIAAHKEQAWRGLKQKE